MTSPHVPGQPQQLREEIEQTRADLGGTVEALAAKTDVKTRAKQALSATAGRTRQQLDAAKTKTVQAADTTKQRVTAASQNPTVRRATPPVALTVGLAAVVGTVIVVAQRRRAARRARSWRASWLDRYR
jgi:hypothetical protein